MKFLAIVLFIFCIACFKDPVDSEIPLAISTPDTNCTCLPTMNAYLWKGKIVYVKTFRGPACNWIPSYYDANGNPKQIGNHITLAEFIQEAVFFKNIWQCN